MGLDPNIILQGQQYDPMQGIGKAVQLSSLMRQGELQGMQADQARQEMQDTMTLRNLYKQHASDPAALLQGVRGAGLYKQADELEKSGLERQKLATDRDKTLGEIDKTKAETLLKRLEYIKSAMTGVIADPSDANIAQALGGFVQSGVMTQEQAQAEYQKVAGMPLAARKQYLMFYAAKQDQAISMLTPKLEALDLGGSRTFVDKNPLTNPGIVGQSFGKTVSPDAAAKASAASKPPAGYRWTASGNLEAIPGGPVEAKPNAAAQKTADAREVLALLDQAEPLLGIATGSYVGAGMDSLNRAFGKSTPGAQGAAQLKALEGSLVAKMPKMSGPQSDKDVLLYRQMAGEIGDPTVPADQKRAAIKVIREINQRYLGESGAAPGGDPAPAAPASLPFADGARVSSGRIAPPAPKAGASEDGYIFLGGDPADPKRWKKASAK